LLVPAAIPDTIPVEPTVATAVFDDDHVPPGVVLLSVVAAPVPTVVMPVIAGSAALTVTIL
jgi:hypothetical protein